jgi:hypothetical protein
MTASARNSGSVAGLGVAICSREPDDVDVGRGPVDEPEQQEAAPSDHQDLGRLGALCEEVTQRCERFLEVFPLHTERIILSNREV